MTDLQKNFMEMAISLSRKGMISGQGGPFGCVIVKDGVVIGKGNNQVLSTNDPTAHAEVVAIRGACKTLRTFQLEGCEIYTSCEPCPMCLGAIYWARPKKVFYANTRKEAADAGFDDDFIYQELPIPPADRKIPMYHTPETDALKVFEEWKNNEDKKVY
ncbi:nucleoside deaminase [Echinicola sp. CAU 1574]|uniref:Nucleoside deaminase n=1 Tax=Echinicola arenosa TaxID=2774144 RepID=A0ABR9AQ93_9BACT|nr:nucleoside deaminase [Echinicola arenosa]MBD8490947.1 nucleoside deaminase [Echinicola arenosa]